MRWRARTVVQYYGALRASRPQLKRDPLGSSTRVRFMAGLRNATLLFCLSGFFRQTPAQTAPFPYLGFQRHDSIARSLLRYDACGWRASDAVMRLDTSTLNRLGPEWLCYLERGRWNAVFGRFDSNTDRYQIVVHYVLHDTVPTGTSEPLDTAAVTARARALHHAASLLPNAFTSSGVRFNPYVVPDTTGLEVWVLPAWQTNGAAVFGAEAEYTFDSSGHDLHGSRVLPGPLRWYRPDSTVAFRLDSNASDVPTVGDLFFFYLVRRYFKSIRIQTPKYSSSQTRTDSGYIWVHVVRDR